METKTIEKNEFGFRVKDMKYMLELFALNPEIEKVILYGSRAMGTYENGSDVDMALTGSKVNFDTVAHIHYVLEEASPMPLMFDVLHYDTLKNKKLEEQIDKHGKIIYERKK